MGVSPNGWFTVKILDKIDDLGVAPFQETPYILLYIYIYIFTLNTHEL